MNTQEVCECPICFDAISDKNNITTECGHKFHASCLMTNVSRNGFDCPCCRTMMATLDENNESESESESEYDSDADSDLYYGSDSTIDSFEDMNNHNDEYILRGFRFFINQIENLQHDQQDEIAEDEMSLSRGYPTVEYITNQCLEKGITINNLVGAILSINVKYQRNTSIGNSYDNILDEIRLIIKNYKNNEEITIASPIVEEPVREYIHPTVTIAKNIKIDFTDLNQIRQDLQLNYPSH